MDESNAEIFGPSTPPNQTFPDLLDVLLNGPDLSNVPAWQIADYLETWPYYMIEVPFGPNPASELPAWSSQIFVDSLEKVDIATIEQDDMRCFHCWNQLGVTFEDESPAEFAIGMEAEDPELWAVLSTFRELPFCECKASNDPIRTPCGHLIGYTCLFDILEATGNSDCPLCKQDMCANWKCTALPRRH